MDPSRVGRGPVGGGGGDRWLDTTGVALFTAAVVWTVFVARWSGTSPRNVTALLLACGGAHVGGRLLGRVDVRLPPLVVVGFVVGATARGGWGFARGPGAPPLDYANANGALFLVGAVAATATAFVVGRLGLRLLALGLAAYLLLAVVLSRSLAASLLALTAVIAAAGAVVAGRAGRRAAPVLAAAGALGLVAALGVTTGLALRHDAGVPPVAPEQRVVQRLDEVRLRLWSEAIAIHDANRLRGAGIDRFQEESPTAGTDSDLRWAHHGFLQQAAEQGTLGGLLLVGVFLWGFARLARARGPDPLVAMAVASLAALGIHATVDYVLHFAAIPPLVALLVGAAVGNRPAGGSRSGPGTGGPHRRQVRVSLPSGDGSGDEATGRAIRSG